MEDNNVEDDGFVTASANQNQKPVVRRFWKWKPLPERGRFPQQWSFWVEDFNKQNHKSGMSSDQFADGLHKVNDFNDMKQFCFHWSKYTDDQGRPKHNCNLLIFHRGITPVWEDPANIIGGHWVIRILKNERKSEQVWYSLLMTVLNGQLPGVNQQEVTGIVISPRDNGTQIYVWNKHSLNSKYKDIMQSFICDSLDVPSQWMRYNTHKHKVYKNKGGKKKQKNEQKEKKHKDKHMNDSTTESKDDDEMENNDDYEIEEDEKDQIEREDLNETDMEILEDNVQESSKNPDIVMHEPITAKTEKNQQIQTAPQSSINMFSISVGIAIFIALIYNIYIFIQ